MHRQLLIFFCIWIIFKCAFSLGTFLCRIKFHFLYFSLEWRFFIINFIVFYIHATIRAEWRRIHFFSSHLARLILSSCIKSALKVIMAHFRTYMYIFKSNRIGIRRRPWSTQTNSTHCSHRWQLSVHFIYSISLFFLI